MWRSSCRKCKFCTVLTLYFTDIYARDRDEIDLKEYERIYRAILQLAPGFDQSLESIYEDDYEALAALLNEVRFLHIFYSVLIVATDSQK